MTLARLLSYVQARLLFVLFLRNPKLVLIEGLWTYGTSFLLCPCLRSEYGYILLVIKSSVNVTFPETLPAHSALACHDSLSYYFIPPSFVCSSIIRSFFHSFHFSSSPLGCKWQDSRKLSFKVTTTSLISKNTFWYIVDA